MANRQEGQAFFNVLRVMSDDIIQNKDNKSTVYVGKEHCMVLFDKGLNFTCILKGTLTLK